MVLASGIIDQYYKAGVDQMNCARYPVDTLQIYFASSLELQEELITHGFQVPGSIDGRIKMPIPLVYSNLRGSLKPKEPITYERVIPPEWLGLTPGELGWSITVRNGRKAYVIPQEEVYVDICADPPSNSITFKLDARRYHLERTSIRGVNPEKWTNWAMFYINARYIDEILGWLSSVIQSFPFPSTVKPRKEVLQGGKEITYYVEVPVRDFSLCLGCFHLAQLYFRAKAVEHCSINPQSVLCVEPERAIKSLKLRIKYDPRIHVYAKVGVAKISGMEPQIMIKLASKGPKKIIHGILKDRIEGKARGSLVYCDHTKGEQYITLDSTGFLRALAISKNLLKSI